MEALFLERGRNFVRFCQISAKEGMNAAFEERRSAVLFFSVPNWSYLLICWLKFYRGNSILAYRGFRHFLPGLIEASGFWSGTPNLISFIIGTPQPRKVSGTARIPLWGLHLKVISFRWFAFELILISAWLWWELWSCWLSKVLWSSRVHRSIAFKSLEGSKRQDSNSCQLIHFLVDRYPLR